MVVAAEDAAVAIMADMWAAMTTTGAEETDGD